MQTKSLKSRAARFLSAAAALCTVAFAPAAFADESKLVLPDLDSVKFLGLSGRTLLMLGLIVCVAGLAFGGWIYRQLKNMEVHKSMLEVSESRIS